MYSFKNDYGEGCHPNIIKKLSETNNEQQTGYGYDIYSDEARELIKNKFNCRDSDIYFVTGGTQANLLVISSILRPHESVVSADSGHINIHEAGAVEATGHKINQVLSPDGKIRPDDIQEILDEHVVIPHMVKPKLVYISNSTEIGTVYKKSELRVLSEFCKNNSMYLFMDGARIGSALTSKSNDLSPQDITEFTDVFYIGGTKNGALLGEAIVINNNKLKEDFGFYMKQKGALLTKGRILGIQFLELFKNDLYFKLAEQTNEAAMNLSKAFKDCSYSFLTEPESNQIFPILPNNVIEKLSKKYGFYVWKKIDENKSAVRLVTSWQTGSEIINEFISDLRIISGK